MQPVFDGHNDVLYRLWKHSRDGADPVQEFIEGTTSGHIDKIRALKGGLIGGLCAIYVPSGDLAFKAPDANGHYSTPLAAPLERSSSLDIALEMASIALKVQRFGGWKLCRSTAEITECMQTRYVRCGAPYGGLRGDWRRSGRARCVLRRRLAFARSSVEPQQYLRPRCALRLSDEPGYGTRTHRDRRRTGQGHAIVSASSSISRISPKRVSGMWRGSAISRLSPVTPMRTR